jgi:hypothetical protein
MLIFALVIAGAGHAWAITKNDITIKVQPKNSGTVTVPEADNFVAVTSPEVGTKVTISAVPADGYTIDKEHILVEKMVNASSRRRGSGVASKIDVEGSGTSYYFIIPEGYDGAYVTATFYSSTANGITSLSQITSDLAGNYVLTADVDASGFESLGNFTGKLDGGFHKIYNLSEPLFTSTSGSAVIRNIIFEDVNISSGDSDGDAGAVTCKATGNTRIYNCGINPSSVERDNAGNITGFSGSTVGGSGNVGGLVGRLEGTARVINCYSYATISGGSNVGGIVGNNTGTTTAGSINTMVMNCMFYGDITGGSTVSPIYGGNNINNLKAETRPQDGLNTYNYYSYENLKTKQISNNKYNCALAVEEKYLNRFEFYRLLLNSNKKLAAFYATGSADNANQMAKWVLETADRNISGRAPYPYPILKAQGYYPSIINPDFDHAPDSASVGRNHGGKLGKTLSVKIQNSTSGGQTAPTGASINTTITLTRTDKDTTRYNFNYDKVQLPYYNDYGTGNYTGNRVVTGWKITEITAINDNDYTSANYPTTGVTDYPNHNYADRKSSNKDLYSVSGRVFSQGAYFDVPYGVTSITIEPYWGKAVYVADKYYDVVYTSSYGGKQGISQVGSQITTFNDQSVSNSISVSSFSESGSVYDNAVVLVGNLHLDGVPSNGNTPFTLMSVDEDNDHEPDYSLVYHHKNRLLISPIRFDFLDVIGTAQAQKPNTASLICNMTICRTKGWFEITNTSLMYFSQFEYENLGKNTSGSAEDNKDKVDAPLILQGGVIDQFVSTQNYNVTGKVIYIHVGGNVWIHEFSMGTHSDGSAATPHVPVSVTGGDFPGFYLTGTYNANATAKDDNAECYISGGRFGELAGAGQEQIGTTGSANKGNVQWQIYNADITNFFGGGINDAKPVQGNITTDIYNSHVTLFCGGPKFGNMASGKNVKTTAEGCVFGKYFGAGYGGNSYSRKKYYDQSGNPNWTTLQGYYTTDRGKYFDGVHTNSKQAGSGSADQYGKKGPGVATDFDYEFFVWSSGTTGARLFVKFVSFSLAQCNDVESKLKSCKILENFYGGGSLGKVSGTATSSLEDCEVTGNVFGAGYSATLPKIAVRSSGFTKKPNFNSSSGMFEPGTYSDTEDYTWKQVDSYPSEGGAGFDGTQVKTTQNISSMNLGSVGSAILTIKGSTTVGGSVYGGGEESGVDGITDVSVTGGTIGTEGNGGAEFGNVYGGGKGKRDDVLAGLVKGSTKVTIQNTTVGEMTVKPTIYHNVYGGGAYGSVGDFDYDATSGKPTGLKTTAAENSGKTEVYITGGTLGWNGKENGMVFGSSRGDVGAPNGIEDKMAWVYDTHVAIGDTTENATISTATPVIMGSVYGGGENGHNLRNSYVRINGGTIGVKTGVKVTSDGVDYEGAAYPYRGNVYGGGCGTDMYYTDPTGVENPYDGNGDAYNPLAGVVQGNAYVRITGGYVVRNIYGAGAMGSVGTDASGGKTTVIISGGRIGYDGNDNGNVFSAARGGQGIAPNLANVKQTEVNISYTTTPAGDNEDKTEQLIAGSVFGGGEAGTVKGDVAVKMGGGLILKDLYGGGALAHTNTNNWKYDTTNQQWGNTWAEGKTSASNTTTVTLTGGAVGGNVYGGGLGRMEVKAVAGKDAVGNPGDDDYQPAVAAVEGVAGIPAKVYGDVTVTLNGTATAGEGGTTLYNDNCVVKGSIFGCNNLNGSPQGDVTVHIYKTQGWEGHAGTATADLSSKDASKHSYHVAAVYGGGNMAAYEPEGGKNTTRATNVIIDGCGLTSIRQVYGGGNAASTPATCVTVNGTHEIEEVFGGGNGKDKITVSGVEKDNPGANVGFYDYSAVEDTYNTKELRLGDDFTKDYIYGTGKASVNIYGGTIHRVFGGSNTKGNVRKTAVTMLEEAGGCDFCVDEAYGGGKSAPMDAEAKLLMACIPGLSAAYGGAEAADIQGNVTLNITNGTFDRVFGGNNESGTIRGSITVNVSEVGCRPVIIGELYGGGNLAGYSIYGYDSDGKAIESGTTPLYLSPQVNVKSFTSIGSVYGGGYGNTAVMVGSPTVNISVANGKYYNDDKSELGENYTTPGNYPVPSHAKEKIGAISNVFGGGNAAKVIGNTNVNIGTATVVYEVATPAPTAATFSSGTYFVLDGNGTPADPYKYVSAGSTFDADTTYYVEKPVVGVDIRGNVYGGGNQAEVTGSTNVVIGKDNK